MCSNKCPCPEGAKQNYADLYAKADGKKRFTAAGRDMSGSSTNPMVFKTSGTTFNSYSDCYDKVLKTDFAKETDQKIKDAYNGFQKDGLDYFKSLEQEYKCGGICSPSFFYVTLPIT